MSCRSPTHRTDGRRCGRDEGRKTPDPGSALRRRPHEVRLPTPRPGCVARLGVLRPRRTGAGNRRRPSAYIRSRSDIANLLLPDETPFGTGKELRNTTTADLFSAGRGT